MGQINDLVKEVHETAKEKGWWDKPRSDLECHMLMVSEISEATEEARIDGGFIRYGVVDKLGTGTYEMSEKPEGEPIELADCVIRIMDYFGSKGWNLEEAIKLKMKYNKTRSYRHGGKKA